MRKTACLVIATVASLAVISVTSLVVSIQSTDPPVASINSMKATTCGEHDGKVMLAETMILKNPQPRPDLDLVWS